MVTRMKLHSHVIFAGLMVATLAGCEARYPFMAGPDTVIATNTDTGLDAYPLPNGTGAVAYDPDGCQVWIVDDGLEGYATRRFRSRDRQAGLRWPLSAGNRSGQLPNAQGRYP